MKFHRAKLLYSRCLTTASKSSSRRDLPNGDKSFQSHLQAATSRHRRRILPKQAAALIGQQPSGETPPREKTATTETATTEPSDAYQGSATARLRAKGDCRGKAPLGKSSVAAMSATEAYRARRASGEPVNEPSALAATQKAAETESKKPKTVEKRKGWFASLFGVTE